MDQIAVQVTLLDILQTILLLPAMLLAYIAVLLTKFLSCNGSSNVVVTVGALGLAYAVFGNVWTGLGVALVAYVEMVMVAIVCMSGQTLVDASMIGVGPKDLARLLHF